MVYVHLISILSSCPKASTNQKQEPDFLLEQCDSRSLIYTFLVLEYLSHHGPGQQPIEIHLYIIDSLTFVYVA